MRYEEFIATVTERGEYPSPDAVSGGELNQILSQLPTGYAELFGKPDLT